MPAEIRRFLEAARGEEDGVFTLFATAVFAGLRAGELAALRWDDVSFERRLITVQRPIHEPDAARPSSAPFAVSP